MIQNNTPQPPCPDNHMVGAILSTICCCLPFGIVAIIKASQVNSLYLQGQYNAACVRAAEAQKWTTISVILGILSMGCVAGLRYFN